MFKFLGNLFKPAAEAYKSRQVRKREEKVAKLKSDSEKLRVNAELVAQGREKDANWEMEAWKHSGWKDDAVLLWFLVTASAAFFFPGRLEEGIDVISGLPDWYTWSFVSIILASHGIRLWRRW